MSAWIFALGGAISGTLQAVLLRRDCVDPRPLGMLLRLLLVGAVLGAAAASSHLAAGVVGWAAGLSAGALALVRRWR